MKAPWAAILSGTRALLDGAAGLWVPPVCPACEAEEIAADGLCRECSLRLMALVAMRYCPRCGATVGPNIPVYEDGCPLCPRPVGRWDRLVRLGPYRPPLSSAVRQLKYRRRRILPRLAPMLAQAVGTCCPDAAFDMVVPVPAYWRRRLARGQDHSRVLARGVAAALDLPVGRELARVRNTPPQVHLPRSRRIENVRGAFEVGSPRAVAGTHALLVDDVTTTGATANEAAKTLLSAGASRVTLAVVAKSEPPAAYAETAAG